MVIIMKFSNIITLKDYWILNMFKVDFTLIPSIISYLEAIPHHYNYCMSVCVQFFPHTSIYQA